MHSLIIHDISRDTLTSKVYDGDPQTQVTKIKSIEKRLESLNNEKEVKKVHKKANELKDSVEDLWNSAYEKGDEVIQKAVDELKTKVNKTISSIEKHLED